VEYNDNQKKDGKNPKRDVTKEEKTLEIDRESIVDKSVEEREDGENEQGIEKEGKCSAKSWKESAHRHQDGEEIEESRENKDVFCDIKTGFGSRNRIVKDSFAYLLKNVFSDILLDFVHKSVYLGSQFIRDYMKKCL